MYLISLQEDLQKRAFSLLLLMRLHLHEVISSCKVDKSVFANIFSTFLYAGLSSRLLTFLSTLHECFDVFKPLKLFNYLAIFSAFFKLSLSVYHFLTLILRRIYFVSRRKFVKMKKSSIFCRSFRDRFELCWYFPGIHEGIFP